MKTMSSKTKTIQEVKKDDHSCLIYNSKLEFLHCLIPFIRDGFKNNEKSLIVLDEIKREDIIRSFKHIYREGPIPASDFCPNGRIIIEQFQNIYLENNVFNMARVINLYLKTLKDALKEGYSGLRAFVEVSVSAKEVIKDEIFFEWAKYADKYFKDSSFQAICAYDKKYFSEEYLRKIISAHPIQIDLIGTRL